MKNYVFFQQKENLTIWALTVLIIMAFVMMHFQYKKTAQNSEYPNATTSKARVSTPNQTEVPHLIPAL
ncbi:hypothetical protein ACE193_17345 [Bernardetia sp. OM2101]|uniref:hypothetical protein n=1 Tax=Bernardetia sp. OM2101 TaxID=3344876 RepID=UPI0035D019AF